MEDRRRRQPGEDVLAPVAAGGEGEQVEQRAAGDPGGERDDGGAVGGDARRRGAARGRGGRRARGWRAAPRSGRAGCRPRTASTTARTAARTSSSPSDAVSTMVRSAATGASSPTGLVRGRDPEPSAASGAPRRRRPRSAGDAGDDGGGHVLGQRREQPGAVLGERAGAGGRRAPRARRPRACPAMAVAASRRSSSSYHDGSSRARVAEWRRTTSAGAVARSGQRRRGRRGRGRAAPGRWLTSADSVAGCSATGANSPGSAASSARIAAASTGVDTGRLPAPASVAAPSSSASR